MKPYTVILLYPVEDDNPESYLAQVMANSRQEAVGVAIAEMVSIDDEERDAMHEIAVFDGHLAEAQS